MADYSRQTQRFFFTGLSTFPPDALPPGKLPYALNMRSYVEGILSPRFGLFPVSDGLGDQVLTLARLNDPTPYNGGIPALRVAGAGGSLFTGLPTGTSYSELDSGYSGNPMTTLSAQPPLSPRPFLYVADRDRQRKFSTDSAALPIGLAQPTLPTSAPQPTVARLKLAGGDDIVSSTAWIAAGANASAPSIFDRITTNLISMILYDSGSTGNCSIVPGTMENITVGTVITVGTGGGIENIVVTDLTIAVASTTVAAIIYDAGSSGLCTIQPTGSLGTGQLEASPIGTYRERAAPAIPTTPRGPRGAPTPAPAVIEAVAGDAGTPPALDPDRLSKRIRQMDFPINSLVRLAGGEVVRILSVAIGEDGFQSFRCSTAGTISAGDSIIGLAAFRCHLNTTRTAGETLSNTALENQLTYPVLPDDTTETLTRVTAGIQGAASSPINWAQFPDGTAVQPEDEVHIAINVDRLTEVQSVRLYADVDGANNDFLHNYFFYEWRANDIITAIQSTNTAEVTPLVDARKTVVTNRQLEEIANARVSPADWGRYGRQLNAKRDIESIQRARTQIGDTAIAKQLAVGNSQWIDLRCKVRQLVRVGTDTTRTLENVVRLEILIAAETLGAVDGVPVDNDPLTVQYDDVWLGGGGSLDVGDVGDPIVFSYRYRSGLTGAVSNPSPASRGGVIPRRQNVSLVATPSTDTQVDKIDWFRFGAGLPVWTYVGTGANSATPYVDNASDGAVSGGETLAFDNFQPWPVLDKPRLGTCNVAGTAIQRVSGDTFDTNWAPGTAIIVNGKATIIYAVASSSLMHVVDNVGFGSAVAFLLPNPTIVGQPMGQLFGDFQGTYFGCGDPLNPGTLYWTKTDNIETTSDANNLLVTPPSEPLQGGFVYNTYAGVFSTQELYQILRSSSGEMRAIRTPCGRGSWTQFSFCVSPQGIIFLAEDGIFLTAGGSPAMPVHPPDLRTIFPKDGAAGVAVNGIQPPDMTETNELRVSYIAGFVYFDYLGLDGLAHTLIIELGADRWFYDQSDLTSIRVRLEEPGEGVFNQIVGGSDGVLYRYDREVFSDAGTDLPYAFWTPYVDGGTPRQLKQFGDVILSANMGASVNGMVLQAVSDDALVLEPPQVRGVGEFVRTNYIVNLNFGRGLLARNLGLRVSGEVTEEDIGRPEFFLWEPTFIVKGDPAENRATDWTDCGHMGAKFIQGIIIRADTFGQNKTLQVQGDGGQVMLTLTINHTGETAVAYPNAAAGWTPFVAELVRLVGADTVPWVPLDIQWVWEPAPELATQWETQWTSHDLPGYFTVRDIVQGYEATSPLILQFFYDDRTQVQVLPETGGLYKRLYLPMCPNKAKAAEYQWKTNTPARLYQRDVSVRVQGWGLGGGYQYKQPFGGPSRSSGAEI